MNRFDSKVELYRTPDETLWESGEVLDALRELGCLLAAFLIAAAYWRFV